MEPAFGRFSALRDAGGSLLFVRLAQGPRLDVISVPDAYTASLNEQDEPDIAVRGRREKPSLRLLALLLALPTTTCTVHAAPAAPINVRCGASRRVSLELCSRDRTGLQLQVSLDVVGADARALLHEMHESLFSAVPALEAVVREAAGEKNAAFVAGRQLQFPSLASVTDLRLPLVSLGKSATALEGFRKAVAADALIQANRALFIGAEAVAVRRDILKQRRVRIEMEEGKRKRQRELLKKAKLRSKLDKARKEQALPAPKKRKKSLFATATGGSPVPAAPAALAPVVLSPQLPVEEQRGFQRGRRGKLLAAHGDEANPPELQDRALLPKTSEVEAPVASTERSPSRKQTSAHGSQPAAKKRRKKRLQPLV